MSKKQYRSLQDRYDEMHEYLLELIKDHNRTLAELRYLSEFINYKNLEDEFQYFQRNAHEEYDEDLPFSRLTL